MMSKKDMSGITQVTFDKSVAELVIKTFGIDKCSSCGKTITRNSYGGSVMLKSGRFDTHNSLPCLLDFIKRSEEEKIA